MRRSRWPIFVLGLIIGILVVPAAVYCYFRLGYAPVATSAQPMPLEANFAHMALHAKVNSEYPRTVPIQADEANLLGGAHVYRENCAVCHGIAGRPTTALAKGMFPKPPQLLEKDDMVTDDPPGMTYWKVANGIRTTGMPSFHQSLSTTQMWQVSLLLANADKLPANVSSVLDQPLPKEQAANPASTSVGK